MTALGATLLIVGLFFPAISWLSIMPPIFTTRRTDHPYSPVFIPFVGPILLTFFVCHEKSSLWLIPAIWVLDIGTVVFLIAMPSMLKQWWETSSFTRILSLHGADGIQSAEITLHKTGHYVLRKSWNRVESGIVGLGEPGTFSVVNDGYELLSCHGLRRRLVRQTENSFLVEEQNESQLDLKDYSLQGWILTV